MAERLRVSLNARTPGQWARCIVNIATGQVVVWPETDKTSHLGVAYGLGWAQEDVRRYMIDPDGVVLWTTNPDAEPWCDELCALTGLRRAERTMF